MFPFLYNLKRVIKLGMRSIVEHKLRSFLTMLGIIFGVGSVIGMLAIGEGASHEAREQIRGMGSKNIILRSLKPAEDGGSGGGRGMRGLLTAYGLKYEDLLRLKELYPAVHIHIPAREMQVRLRYGQNSIPTRIVGTVPWALENSSYSLKKGRFLDARDVERNENVVVLTEATARILFPLEFPLGKNVYLGGQSYQVVGILREHGTQDSANTASRKELQKAFIPITAARRRFGDVIMNRESGSMTLEKIELHQLTLTAPTEESVVPLAAAVRETLLQTHKKTDFEITVPLELLRQAESTKRIFNVVLGSIAAISLLVGGIGIMNIMLANVTERTREIGIRRALGATRTHIVVQFLTEALLLSFCGGLLGIALGIAVPKTVTHLAGLTTLIRPDSILLAFSIALATGVVFGIYPAIRAAQLSPMEALRHE